MASSETPWQFRQEYLAATDTTIVPGDPLQYDVPRHYPATDISDHTSYHPGQRTWNLDNLPDIMYQIYPDKEWHSFMKSGLPGAKVDQSGRVAFESWPYDPENPRVLKNFPILPDQIGTKEHPLFFEMWRRLDPRIRMIDITMRMYSSRVKENVFNTALQRARVSYTLLAWNQSWRTLDANKSRDKVIAALPMCAIEANSSRGHTPGLIIPSMGEIGGRIPHPFVKSHKRFHVRNPTVPAEVPSIQPAPATGVQPTVPAEVPYIQPAPAPGVQPTVPAEVPYIQPAPAPGLQAQNTAPGEALEITNRVADLYNYNPQYEDLFHWDEDANEPPPPKPKFSKLLSERYIHLHGNNHLQSASIRGAMRRRNNRKKSNGRNFSSMPELKIDVGGTHSHEHLHAAGDYGAAGLNNNRNAYNEMCFQTMPENSHEGMYDHENLYSARDNGAMQLDNNREDDEMVHGMYGNNHQHVASGQGTVGLNNNPNGYGEMLPGMYGINNPHGVSGYETVGLNNNPNGYGEMLPGMYGINNPYGVSGYETVGLNNNSNGYDAMLPGMFGINHQQGVGGQGTVGLNNSSNGYDAMLPGMFGINHQQGVDGQGTVGMNNNSNGYDEMDFLTAHETGHNSPGLYGSEYLYDPVNYGPAVLENYRGKHQYSASEPGAVALDKIRDEYDQMYYQVTHESPTNEAPSSPWGMDGNFVSTGHENHTPAFCSEHCFTALLDLVPPPFKAA